MAGTVLVTIGLALMSTMDETTSRLTTSLYTVVLGAGLGALMQIGMTIAVFGSLFTRTAGAAPTPAAVTAATRHIFLIAAGVGAAGLLAALAVREVPLRHQPRTLPAPSRRRELWPASPE